MISERGLALTVYILYLVGLFTGFPAVLGVIIAYVKRPSASEVVATHFRFQIRTFWIGALYFLLGWSLAGIIIGIFLLLWWFSWTLVRVVIGFLRLNDGKPIKKPTSWLFG